MAKEEEKSKEETRPVLRLASASARRRELLNLIGVPHVVTPADIDETPRPAEAASAYVARLAREKAAAVRRQHPDLPVLAADTTVHVDGAILEKPGSEADCMRMLSLLSGRRHQVFTGLCVVGNAAPSVSCTHTEVEFRRISRHEMSAYWASGEPQGKAGAYAIQGFGAVFVEKITGSYTNVMGLPLFETAQALRSHGIAVWNGALGREGKRVTTEILINVAPRETRASLIENGVLTELFIERQSRRGIVSNLYKGRVQRVLPGMQAAFIDVGLERTAFLHAADIASPVPESTLIGEQNVEDIRRLVNEGDDILVQVVKDPMGTKGARLTTFVALPSRLMVYMPRGDGIGVSARIEDEAERARLKQLVTECMHEPLSGGYIVRTAAQGANSEAIREDIQYLGRLWQHVREKGLRASAGELVYEDLPLPTRILRDELARGVDRVLVDNVTAHSSMLEFAASFMPGSTTSIELYSGQRPIFDLHGVEEEIGKALERNVSLKSGGHLVIDQTESMTTIDVNTGGFVGHRNLEDTIFRTNLEAAVAIARQLRLRNLGGIIIIDFIDMTDPAHRTQVMEALQRALAGDHAQTHIASVSSLGLVEMTRKRTRDSLEHLLCAPCPSCEGRGFACTPETVCHEIFREIVRQSRQFQSRELLILAHQNVIDRLLDDESAVLAELEHQVGRPIRLQVEALYGFDQYDVVLA